MQPRRCATPSGTAAGPGRQSHPAVLCIPIMQYPLCAHMRISHRKLKFQLLLSSRRGVRAERQMDDIQRAKEQGVGFGGKKKLTMRQIVEMQHGRKQGTIIGTLMKDYDLSAANVYRYLSEDGAH